MDLTLTQAFELQLAGAAVAVDGPLDGALVSLYINDVLPVRTSVLADFEPTTYVGSADQEIAWSTPSISDDGIVEVVGVVPQFRPTNAVTPNTVFGALVINAADVLLMGGRFDDAPLPMESNLDAINMTVRYRPSDQSIAIVVS